MSKERLLLEKAKGQEIIFLFQMLPYLGENKRSFLDRNESKDPPPSLPPLMWLEPVT